jgi:hypothetical protein
VNYILLHRTELVKHLSPIHSPMLCTAVYMSKYERLGTKIAAISPCAAKTHEFEATRLVDYNVTIQKLYEYIERNNIRLPDERSGFDHYDAGLGSLYPMPGGLKECVEHYIGKSIRIDKSEGQKVVYNALDEYAKQPLSRLPVLFDVLNCPEGCNMGTGCGDAHPDIFKVNTLMDGFRQEALKKSDWKYLDELFEKFDKTLKLEDFIRKYTPAPVRPRQVTAEQIENAFALMNKFDETARSFDCGACGNDSCLEMAKKIAAGINTPFNCIQKMHQDILKEHEVAKADLANFDVILTDIGLIREMTEHIVTNIGDITDAVSVYNRMIADIEKIALQINIIALNASIESARAGQHGKAFSVVAEEIRRLAQSSNNSAQQTKNMSVKANNAIESVNEMMIKIHENVQKSYQSISEISSNVAKNYGNDAQHPGVE